jgi:putative endonuclease
MYVYIMSNMNRTTFYTGVTNNLKRRVLEHKSLKGSVFTSKYKLVDLIYYEEILGPLSAITREKQIKNRPRKWKLNLIKQLNPELRDLSGEFAVEKSRLQYFL